MQDALRVRRPLVVYAAGYICRVAAGLERKHKRRLSSLGKKRVFPPTKSCDCKGECTEECISASVLAEAGAVVNRALTRKGTLRIKADGTKKGSVSMNSMSGLGKKWQLAMVRSILLLLHTHTYLGSMFHLKSQNLPVLV